MLTFDSDMFSIVRSPLRRAVLSVSSRGQCAHLSAARPPKWFALAPKIKTALLKSNITEDEDMANLISKSAAIGCYGCLGATVLGTLGVDTTPVVAGIGVTGFTVGFALKEIATNFLSGFLLVLQKPFHKGQHLRVLLPSNNVPEGVVESIDIRYVILRDDKGKTIMIPSALVYSNSLVVGSPPPPTPQNEGAKA